MRAGRSSWRCRPASKRASPRSTMPARTSPPSTSLKQVAADGALGIRLWVMVRDSNENLRAKLRAVQGGRPQRQPPDDRGDQGRRRRRARLARRVDARAVQRFAVERRPADQLAGEHRARRRGSRSRTTCSCACTRSAIAPIAKCSNVYERAFKQRPDQKDLRWRIEHAQHIERRRHPALRAARRDRGDAGHSRHLGCAVRAGAPRRRSAPKKARTCGRS